MVKISLNIRADLENIEKLYVEPDTFVWWLSLVCTNCREETGKFHDLCLSAPIPNRIGHGHVHYASKCKMCSKESSIEILPGSISSYSKGSPFTPIVSFEFRGLEPTKFDFRGDWIAKSENSSLVFEDVDLSAGEWVEYDESAKEPVGIYALEYEFKKA